MVWGLKFSRCWGPVLFVSRSGDGSPPLVGRYFRVPAIWAWISWGSLRCCRFHRLHPPYLPYVSHCTDGRPPFFLACRSPATCLFPASQARIVIYARTRHRVAAVGLHGASPWPWTDGVFRIEEPVMLADKGLVVVAISKQMRSLADTNFTLLEVCCRWRTRSQDVTVIEKSYALAAPWPPSGRIRTGPFHWSVRGIPCSPGSVLNDRRNSIRFCP